MMRGGYISWVNTNEPNRTKFLIDCSIFGGNSGGPVFTYPEVRISKDGKRIFRLQPKLLGIITHRLTIAQLLEQNGDSSVSSNEVELIYREALNISIVEPMSKVSELMEQAIEHWSGKE